MNYTKSPAIKWYSIIKYVYDDDGDCDAMNENENENENKNKTSNKLINSL